MKLPIVPTLAVASAGATSARISEGAHDAGAGGFEAAMARASTAPATRESPPAASRPRNEPARADKRAERPAGDEPRPSANAKAGAEDKPANGIDDNDEEAQAADPAATAAQATAADAAAAGRDPLALLASAETTPPLAGDATASAAATTLAAKDEAAAPAAPPPAAAPGAPATASPLVSAAALAGGNDAAQARKLVAQAKWETPEIGAGASHEEGAARSDMRSPIAAAIAQALRATDAGNGTSDAVVAAMRDLPSFKPVDLQPRPEPADAALAAPRADNAAANVPFASLLTASASLQRNAAVVATAVGQPGFDQEVGQRVLMLVNGQVRSAELALTPAELGPVKVTIEVRGQDASISFAAASPATRAALEEAMPRLREMFAQQGMNLADAHVGAQLGQRRESPDEARQARAGDPLSPDAAAVDAAAAATTVLRRPLRLIDVTA
jgi:flagellar hook-length control protein FliK